MNFDNKQLAVCVLCAVCALGCGDAASGDAFAGQGGQAGGDSGSSSDATSANGSTSSASSGSSSSGGSVGNMLSVKRYGDSLGQQARAVAHFPNGDIAVVGSFFGMVDFGGGAAETSEGAADIFVVRYTREGSHVWTRALGSKYDDSDDGFDVAIDPVGDVIVVGGAEDHSGYPQGWCHTSNGCYGGLVIGKLNGATGAPMWGRVGQGSSAAAHGVAVDAKGNVLVTGDFGGWPDDGVFGNMIDGSNVSNNPVKGFIAKYSPDGDPLWSRQLAHYDGVVVGQAVVHPPSMVSRLCMSSASQAHQLYATPETDIAVPD